MNGWSTFVESCVENCSIFAGPYYYVRILFQNERAWFRFSKRVRLPQHSGVIEPYYHYVNRQP